jgi:hypothetical protein
MQCKDCEVSLGKCKHFYVTLHISTRYLASMSLEFREQITLLLRMRP